MDVFFEAFVFALDRWWQIGLTILGSSAAIVFAQYVGLNRPWPFPIVLSGILSHMIMEAYPHAWTIGEFTGIGLWVIMACLLHLLPYFTKHPSSNNDRVHWDDFDEISSFQRTKG